MEKFGYIYLSTCLIDNKVYVGKHERSSFDKNYYGGGINQRKWLNKYGKENFKIEVIQWCYSRKELSDAEKYWEAYYRNQVGDDMILNIATGGISGDKFIHNPRHQEYRNKLRDAIIEQDRKGENHPFYGKHHTSEAKKRISIAQQGKTMSIESRKKISESKKGHIVTQDTRNKISSTLTGHKQTKQAKHNIRNSIIKLYAEHPERREKLSKFMTENNPFKGKTHTEEMRRHLSDKRKQYYERMNNKLKLILHDVIKVCPEVENYKISAKIRLIRQIAEIIKENNI